MKNILLLNIFALMLLSFQMSAQCTIQVVTTDITKETCAGSSDASATATAGGGVAPINYLWSDGQTTAIAANLTTGTYTVTATDDVGCTGTATAEITLDPEGVWLMFTSTPVSCNGGSDGTAHVSVMTGVAPYTYIWNDPAGTTNADPVNLAAGQYTVTVTDSNGCSNYGPVTITQPTVIVVTSSTTNETCFGDADGTASVSVSGGTPGYTYVWSDGQTTATANSLTAGNYIVTVTDANGCPSTTTLTVSLTNPQIMITGTSTPVSCFGGNDGSATVSVNSGNGPFSYSWSNGGSTATIPNLIAGDYAVTVTGANGCTSVTTVSVEEAPELIVTATTTNVLCQGGSDGSITASSTGGTGSVTYLWSNGETTGTISNLSVGTYTVTATDGNGCATTTSATIDLTNPQIVIAGTSASVSCFGENNGSAAVAVNSGNGPFSYSWSNGGTTATIPNLIAGDYTVTVTGADGCTSVTTVSVSEPPELIVTTTVTTTTTTNVLCHGASDGSITVSSTGGTGSVTYSWSNGETTGTISNLPAGTYTVTATDDNGCTTTTTTIITEASELIAPGTGTNVTINGGNDGTATVTPSGGTPGYTYLWSNGQTTATATNLTAGTYTVTVTDSNGCTTITTIIINEPPPSPIILTITSTPSTCGSNDGTATVTPSGGTPGYTYLWSDGQTNATATGLTGGTYTVTVTDSNGLTSTTSVTVTSSSPIIATTSHSDETCVGSSDGHVAVSTNGGVGQNSFLWSNGATTVLVNNLSVGTYTVTVTDQNGCTASATETIELSPEGIWVDINTTPISCFNGNNGSASSVVTTGVAPYTYAWSNGGNTPTISNLSAGDYTVSVTDLNGCIGIFTTTITQPTQLIATTTSTNTTCGLTTGTANVTATGGTLGYTYLWSNGQTNQNINGLTAGTYTATVTDANGCTAVSSTTITNMDLVIVTTASATNPSGPGASDGSINIQVTGGSNYTYLWSNGATTQNITGLMAGCYTVTVTDGAGVCAAIHTVCIGCMLDLVVTTTENDCMNNIMGTATATITSSCSSTTYTYIWTTSTGAPVGTTQTISGLLDGTYNVTVTDGNGNTVTGSGMVMGSNGITSTATGTNLLCNGATTGTATGNGFSGSSTYTYMWSNGANTQTITNLSAGVYTVTVTDTVTGCTSVSQVTIVEPPVTTITASVTNPTTIGGSNGSINITVTGGTPGYTYMWSNGATTQNITGLTEGCYTVTVTDSNNCTATETICIDGCTLNLVVTTTNNDCVNNSIGTITATITSNCSSTTYTYNWTTGTGGTVGTTQTISGLLNGTYIVTVTDGNGNTVTGSGVIAGTGGITSSITATNNVCNGDSTGTATVTGIGGSTYTYMWSNNGTTQTITTLTPGTYTVTVTDTVTGCTSVSQVTIVEPPVTTITATTSNPTGGNGSISIMVTGGTPGYTYSWSTGDTTQNVMGLPAGCYTVTVTDANGCTTTAEPCIPPMLSCLISMSSTPETCNPGTNGTAMASIVGCTPPVSFVWENSGGDVLGNTPMIMNLTTGMYYVTVTDANLISKNDSIEVIYLGGPDANASAEDISCFNDVTSGGQVSAVPTGGTSPYNYNWSDAIGAIGNADTIFNLSAGTYTVTITDAVGCTATEVVEIEEEAPMTLTPVTTPLNCFGDANATISVTPTGGVSPYTYLWNNSTTNDNITGLTTGVYTVTVTDQNLCTIVDSFMISEPSAMNVFADPDTSICETSLMVNATASAGATVSWLNQNSDIIGTGSPFAYSNIPSGSSTIYVVAEENGCKVIDSITVVQNAVDVSVTPSASICLGDNTPLMATNNIASHDIDYVWTPTNQFVTDTDTLTNPTLLASVAGNFMAYLSATNQFGCELIDSVLISVQDTAANFIIKQQCIGLEVNYTSASGTPMIWNYGDGSPQDTATSTTHTYISAQDYTVMMILPPGASNADCLPDTITQIVPVADDPIFATEVILMYDSCAANNTLVQFEGISTNVFNSPIVSWDWELSSGANLPSGQQGSLIISQTSFDTLQLIVMNEEECLDTMSMPIDINIVVDTIQDITVCIGTEVELNPSPNADYDYSWSPTPTGGNPNANPIVMANQSTTYIVTITDNSSSFPCQVEADIELIVPQEIDLQTMPASMVLCEAGLINLSATSSVIPVTYNWYDINLNPLNSNSPNYSFDVDNNSGMIEIVVEAIDSFGCAVIDTILTGNAEIIFALDDVDNCIGTEEIIENQASSSAGQLEFEWFDPNMNLIAMTPTLTLTPSLPGTYTVEASNDYCSETAGFNIDIIDVSDDVQATAAPDTIVLGEIAQLDVEHPNNVEGYKYLWSPAISLLGNNPSEDKSPEAMPEVNTDYQVVVTDLDNGCTAITNVFVTVLNICEKPYVFFPNVFSPNGDGRNDILKVESVVVDEVYFAIYNRWGEKVFEGNSVDSAWDGTHNGKAVSTDVYGYYLRARCVNGEVYEDKGNVTVLR